MNIKKQIEIYGDSIMRGVILDRVTNRYGFNKENHVQEFERAFPLQIQNKASFGCTITKGKKMLEKALQKEQYSDMILLEFGGNDCDFQWPQIAAAPEAEHFPNTPLPLFVETYRSMIRLLQAHNIVPIVVSLPPIDAERYFAWFTRNGLNQENILRWLGDVQMIYRHQELYSLAVTKIAYETGSLFADVRSAFLDKHNYKDLLCEDGIHPNPAGHRLIVEVLRDFTQKTLPRFGGA